MDTRGDHLLRLASVLDDIRSGQQATIRERHTKTRSAGPATSHLRRQKSSPPLMAARFVTIQGRAAQGGVSKDLEGW